MGTEGVNGKLLLLALAYDSSDIGAMLPGSWDGWISGGGMDGCLGLGPREPPLPHTAWLEALTTWQPPRSPVCLQHRQNHPEGKNENILST